ncbi:hypothetical protein HC081234_04920 [Helicobacter cinaedi]|nr:hypothetical protein HC081234_04920 [Helicobacter cinaedi]
MLNLYRVIPAFVEIIIMNLSLICYNRGFETILKTTSVKSQAQS